LQVWFGSAFYAGEQAAWGVNRWNGYT